MKLHSVFAVPFIISLTACGDGSGNGNANIGAYEKMFAREALLLDKYQNDPVEYTNPSNLPNQGHATYSGLVRLQHIHSTQFDDPRGFRPDLLAELELKTDFTDYAVTGTIDKFTDRENNVYDGSLGLIGTFAELNSDRSKPDNQSHKLYGDVSGEVTLNGIGDPNVTTGKLAVTGKFDGNFYGATGSGVSGDLELTVTNSDGAETGFTGLFNAAKAD